MSGGLAALPADVQVVIEVALAMVLGGAIGFEREWAARPAGLRTHMLVSGAAALLAGTAIAMVGQFAEHSWGDRLSVDPIRVMQAIIVGVTFLGAGTIVHSRDNRRVEGLTTAASLLMVAGVGIAVAMQEFVIAIGVTVLVLVALRGLIWVQARISTGKTGTTNPQDGRAAPKLRPRRASDNHRSPPQGTS